MSDLHPCDYCDFSPEICGRNEEDCDNEKNIKFRDQGELNSDNVNYVN